MSFSSMCQIIKFCTIQFSFFILTLSSYHASLLFPRHRSNVLFPSHRVNAVEGVTSWLTGLAGSLTTAQWGRRSCSTLLSLLASLPSTVLVGWLLRTTIVCRPVKSPDQSPVGDEVVLGCSTITPGCISDTWKTKRQALRYIRDTWNTSTPL